MTLERSVCTTCGAMGASKAAIGGSIVIEIILWLCFLVPGLIYSIWRLGSKHEVCPACGNRSMISRATPRGAKLVTEAGGWSATAEELYMLEARSRWFRRIPAAAICTLFAILFLSMTNGAYLGVPMALVAVFQGVRLAQTRPS